MTVAHARALVGGASLVARFDPEGDARALRALAEWAMRFTPVVAPDPPDGLLLDVTGCERLHRGEDRLLNAMANSIGRLGFACRLAAAPTFGTAWGVARFDERERSRVAEGGVRGALAPLPVSCLRLERDVVESLAEVGIERVAHLFEVSRESIAARFGTEPLVQLDRALGAAMEFIEPVRPAPPPSARRRFAGPVAQVEAIERAAEELLELLCVQLAAQESGARRLVLHLERSDLDPTGFEIALSRPSRDHRHLWSLLRPRLETAHLGFGVDEIVLTAAGVGRLAHRQSECWSDDRPGVSMRTERLFAEMVDALSGRLGTERVTRVETIESHAPERAFRHVPAVRVEGAARSAPRVVGSPRPSILFDRPEEARVISITPDGPPMRLSWRGEEHAIRAAVGPERLAGEWWATRHATIARDDHDHFRVETDRARWLWMRRTVGTSRWSVLGEWA